MEGREEGYGGREYRNLNSDFILFVCFFPSYLYIFYFLTKQKLEKTLLFMTIKITLRIIVNIIITEFFQAFANTQS